MGVHRFVHLAMHTHFSLLVDAEEEASAKEAALECWELVDRLLSRFRYGSDISILNSAQKIGAVSVDEETLACLKVAADIYVLTGGAFDITITPVLEVYREKRTGRGIDTKALERAEKRIGRDGWALDGRKVRIERVGTQLDLGGVAKGYALDRMAEVLESHGITSALINTGQSTLLATDQKAWPITPEESKDKLTLAQGALSSSSNLDGHIIDPRSGKAAESSWLTVMVKAPTAGLADALSTGFMLLHEQQIRDVCEADPKIAVRLYHKDKETPIKVGDNPF